MSTDIVLYFIHVYTRYIFSDLCGVLSNCLIKYETHSRVLYHSNDPDFHTVCLVNFRWVIVDCMHMGQLAKMITGSNRITPSQTSSGSICEFLKETAFGCMAIVRVWRWHVTLLPNNNMHLNCINQRPLIRLKQGLHTTTTIYNLVTSEH